MRKIEELQKQTGFDEDVVGCFVHNFEKKGRCEKVTSGWCKDYFKCSSMRAYLERKARLKRACVSKGYYKDWFIFPFCICITHRRELMDWPLCIELHFLWWHWRYTFLKG